MNTEIDRKLKVWKVEVEVPTRFQANVWQRISRENSARGQSFLHQFAVLLSSLLLRPQYATAIVLLAAFIGLSTARMEARNTNFQRWKHLENRYAVSIDPIAMANRESTQ